jgi:hypothetical protein
MFLHSAKLINKLFLRICFNFLGIASIIESGRNYMKKSANIKIRYDGEWPCLCMGNLTVIIDGNSYDFPPCCLSSGGSVSFDADWGEHVTHGDWAITEWPENFPEEFKKATEDAVNEQVCHGCCGGCV